MGLWISNLLLIVDLGFCMPQDLKLLRLKSKYEEDEKFDVARKLKQSLLFLVS